MSTGSWASGGWVLVPNRLSDAPLPPCDVISKMTCGASWAWPAINTLFECLRKYFCLIIAVMIAVPSGVPVFDALEMSHAALHSAQLRQQNQGCTNWQLNIVKSAKHIKHKGSKHIVQAVVTVDPNGMSKPNHPFLIVRSVFCCSHCAS